MSIEFLFEFISPCFSAGVNKLEHFNIGISILQLNFWQKFRSNRDQPLLRPFLKPIYAGAVDQTGEHS